MKNTIMKTRYPFRAFILFVSLYILILSSVLSVYADPDEKTSEGGAWVEVVCTIVPEDFEGSVSVVLSDVETDERYTIDCLKANAFVGRQKLPYGKYYVDWIYTSDTFYYEGFTDLYSFELTKEMAAAKKIEIEVIKNNVPDDVFTMVPGTQSDAEASVNNSTEEDRSPQEESDDQVPSTEPTVNNVMPEQGNDTSTDDELDENKASSEEPLTTKNVLRNIGISLFVTCVFIAIVALIVYFVRFRYFDEE